MLRVKGIRGLNAEPSYDGRMQFVNNPGSRGGVIEIEQLVGDGGLFPAFGMYQYLKKP